MFKNTNHKISFTTEYNSETIKSNKNKDTKSNKFNKSGIYQLTCQDCNKKYIGQTGWPLHIRFQEHFRDFKYGNGKSKFVQRLLDNRHAIGQTENIMEILHVKKKASMINTPERFYINNETKIDNQINDKGTVKQNTFTQ